MALSQPPSSAFQPSPESDSSYDFLSAEEKACLLFLEETIGSLDTEVDSGLSTGSPEEEVPAPVLKKGQPQPSTVTQPSSLQSPSLRSGSQSLPRNIHISRPHCPRNSTPQTASCPPGSHEELAWAPAQDQGQQGPARDAVLDMTLIPPQKGFQDSQKDLTSEPQLPSGPGQQLSPPKKSDIPVETMAQRANEKGVARPVSVASSQERAREPTGPPRSNPEAQGAPLTAPKSRKLPPNIVLKSSRGSLRGDQHTRLLPGDTGLAASSLQEQRRARSEALQKLGLPQEQEPSVLLNRPGRLREPRAAAKAQLSSSLQNSEAPSGPPPGKAAAQGSVPTKVRSPARDPAPRKTTAITPGPVPQKPDWELTLQESSIPGLRQASFKSNTLERSGVGLSSSISAAQGSLGPQTSSSLGKVSFLDKSSPGALRNSRPRPASLGTGKDFAGIQVSQLAELEQGQSSKRPTYQGQSRDKLPRPPCVSVKISPKGAPNEHRREALRKLGLLKE